MNSLPAPCPLGWFPPFTGIKGQRAAPPHSLAGCGHQGDQELQGLWCPSKWLGRGMPGDRHLAAGRDTGPHLGE